MKSERMRLLPLYVTRNDPNPSEVINRDPEATLPNEPLNVVVEARTVNESLPETEFWKPAAKETIKVPFRPTVPFTFKKLYWLPWVRPPSWKLRLEAESSETLPVTARPLPPRAGRKVALLLMAALMLPRASTRPLWNSSALFDWMLPPARTKE